MESYLMMLYVTLEQESALKNFFVDHGWTFCKPDLSVTTDKLGPVVPNPPILSEETDLSEHAETDINLPEADETALRKQTFPTIKINIPPSKPTAKTASPKQKGKRKTKSPKQTATKAKQAKFMTNTSVPEASESNEMLEAGAVESTESETQGTSEIKTPITVQSEDGNQFTIKIEQESHDSDKDEDEVDKSDVIGDDDYDEDGDDDNDEATDIDYSYEEASTSEVNASIKTERQSLGDNSVKVDSAAAASGSGSTGKNPKRKKMVVFRCKICSKEFVSRGNLSKHMKRHGEKQITCHICSKGFFRNDEMRQHMLYLHEDEAPLKHICDICGKMFKTRSALTTHCSARHFMKKTDNLKCEICGKILSCKRHKLDHERRHVEGFKFTQCNLCNRFYKNSNIEDHIKVCSSMEETEKHACAECGSLFLTSKALARHTKKQHGLVYQCNACGMRFSDRNAALGHTSSCLTADTVYMD